MRPSIALVVVAFAACHPAPAPIVASAPPAPTRAAPSEVAIVQHFTPAQIAARSTGAIALVNAPPLLGSGFVVDAHGVIATNLHVVLSDAPITVTFGDKRTLPVVAIVGISERHDLALLQVDATDLPVLPLGDSDAMRPGDPVVAIGHPFGLEDTVSNGLLSGVRPLEDDLTVLQISAPISPGSSGGPIFDDAGEVIGVATAIFRNGQNIAFGMPAKYVKELLADPQPIAVEDFVNLMRARRAAHTASLPKPPPRDVPHLGTAALAGCNEEAMRQTVMAIGQAIEVGAPLYNAGKIEACYHVYEGAALDLERKLPKSCKGPVKALAAGRSKAAALGSPSDQAWAMRDAFDGLVDVIDRKHHE